MSENFFTAIYCLVFRRDHAIRAYSQDVVGPPFSSLLTCVPTAHYVCNHLFQEMGYWLGEPCVVVNMNVSWARYAPVWVLELSRAVRPGRDARSRSGGGRSLACAQSDGGAALSPGIVL